ncbi:MAG: hypothetical protein ACK4FA_01105 [Candidatus Paceibacteria bacterium]
MKSIEIKFTCKSFMCVFIFGKLVNMNWEFWTAWGLVGASCTVYLLLEVKNDDPVTKFPTGIIVIGTLLVLVLGTVLAPTPLLFVVKSFLNKKT